MRLDDYNKLAEEMRQCTACPLCSSRTQVVVDRGNPSARLLFIGEAPGQSEDAEGKAFVGAAGQLLDELIAQAGLAPDSFLIINVLRCRPPENKFPGDTGSSYKADIVNQCLGWLDKQFELVNPKVVILVGRKAAEWTIYRHRQPAPPMHEMFGQWIQSDLYPRTEFFGIYHTAYLLRLRRQDETKAVEIEARMIETLKMAADALNGDMPEIEPIELRSAEQKSKQMKFF